MAGFLPCAALPTPQHSLVLIAGPSLAAFVIPESLVYASLAQLLPVTGLYCYLVAGIEKPLLSRPLGCCKIRVLGAIGLAPAGRA